MTVRIIWICKIIGVKTVILIVVKSFFIKTVFTAIFKFLSGQNCRVFMDCSRLLLAGDSVY
jgi:hypothetical protein